MIKYFVNEEKRQVIGLLENTRWDAFNKICKTVRDTDFCVVPHEKYMWSGFYQDGTPYIEGGWSCR